MRAELGREQGRSDMTTTMGAGDKMAGVCVAVHQLGSLSSHGQGQAPRTHDDKGGQGTWSRGAQAHAAEEARVNALMGKDALVVQDCKVSRAHARERGDLCSCA